MRKARKTSASLAAAPRPYTGRSLLRAEQWVMVGVVGIGAFAAYLLTRARPRDLERIDFAPRQPAPSALAQNILRPGPLGQSSHALLRRGDNVLGRLELGGDNRAGDDVTALQNLQLAGFSNVRLFSVADVTADPGLLGFVSLENSTPGSRWFFGTWNGNGTVAAGDIVMPREVVLLSYAATTPPPRMAFAST